MNILDFYPARAKVRIDGGGSVTAFAATTNQRWVMTNFNVGWSNMTTSATVALWESTATGSMADGSVFFQFSVSNTSGTFFLSMGDRGTQASDTNSQMGITTGAIAGTMTAVFAGYFTGG